MTEESWTIRIDAKGETPQARRYEAARLLRRIAAQFETGDIAQGVITGQDGRFIPLGEVDVNKSVEEHLKP